MSLISLSIQSVVQIENFVLVEVKPLIVDLSWQRTSQP